MQCAKCSGTLQSLHVNDIVIDRCDQCEGIWFDRQELTQILRADQAHALEERAHSGSFSASRADSRPGRCPRCSVALERVASLLVSDIGYDSCPDCLGVWLDKGELGELSSDPDAAAVVSFFTDF